MRTLRGIACDIRADWHDIRNQGAVEALNCMMKMDAIEEPFFADANGAAVVGTFLGHAIGWRGPTARRIKKELRSMCGV
jgi:hypothetical protein